jgi:hypothetical protein
LIARADAKLGRLVASQETYFRIQREQLAADAPAAFVEAQQKAAKEQAELAPRVPSLTVRLDGGTAADVTVTLDGAALPSALIGLPGPVDPGEHTVSASGASLAADPVTISIGEGAKQTVTLALTRQANPSITLPAPSNAEGSPTHSALPLGGWIAVGVGTVGLVMGTIFVVKNRTNRNQANALCTASGCPESKRADITSLDSSANSAATIAWVSYGVGVAGLATGAVLLWLGSGRHAAPQTARVVPWVGMRTAGVTVTF